MTGREGSTPGPIPPEGIARYLEAAADTILAEFEALGGDAGWRPAPGAWSANETLGHLLEAERRGFNGRIRTIMAQPEPILIGWDQIEVAAARGDVARDPTELLAEFLELRADSVELVLALSPEDLDRVGHHDRVGSISIGDLLGEWVHHDRNHVKQILSVAQERVWPQMGHARRFSDPSA